jgi:hypothetical protein
MAKVARVRISKELLEQIIRADFGQYPGRTVTTNAPKDLEILGVGKIEGLLYPHTFELYVKSETFDDVPEGAEPPEIEAFTYTVHHGE